MLYRLFVPAQAVGASLVYFDFFNNAPANIEVVSLLPIVSGAVAVVGVVGVDLNLTRTTAIGTGGTAATAEGTSVTAASICAVDCTQKIDSSITARITPTGGGTAGAVLGWRCVFTEETASASYVVPPDLARNGYELPGVTVFQGTGLRVIQGSVASVGNIGFDMLFKVYPK